MVLSARAERLAPRVRLLMAELERTLGEDAFDPAVTERSFRVAASDDAVETLVAPAIESIRPLAPCAQFEIVAVSEGVADDLAAGRIDVAVAADWWLRHVRAREPLFMDRYVVMCNARRRFTLAGYAQADHVLVAPHGRKPGTVDAALRKHGLTRRVSVTVPDFASAARLAASPASLVATMPSRVATCYARHHALHIIDPPLELPEVQTSMAVHPRAAQDPGVAWLSAQLRLAKR